MGAHASSTELKKILTEPQLAFLNQLGGLLGGELGQPGNVPGASPLQQAGFQQLTQQPMQQGAYQSALANVLGGTPAAAYDISPEARQGVYETQRAQALQDWQQNTIPTIMEAYNARGLGRSGGLESALASSGQQLGTNLAGMQAQLEYQDEQARRAALESGANRNLQSVLGGIQGYQAGQGLEQSRLGQILAAGEQQRSLEMQQQPYANPWLTYIPQLLGTQAMAPTQSSWGFSYFG